MAGFDNHLFTFNLHASLELVRRGIVADITKEESRDAA